MTRGEDRTATFLLTMGTAGGLGVACTRFISLMRVTPVVVVGLIVGLGALVLLLGHMGLCDDRDG